MPESHPLSTDFLDLLFWFRWCSDTFGGNGNSILTASLLLGIMILPTIIETSEAAIAGGAG